MPVAVANITDATDVSVGATHACALIGDGTVECWGRNGNGQLGNGTTSNSSMPVTVSDIAPAH
jgi:alpha-tubulin suppressor-like RCC1 family protein